MRWREESGLRWLQADLPGATAAFTTRLGGISAVPFDELNLGLLTGDSRDAVAENRNRLAAALGHAPSSIAIGRQVHEAAFAEHSVPQDPSPYANPGTCDPPEVDGHLIDRSGLAGLVFVADCLPVVVAARGRVAVLHCGWRPLAAGIIARALDAPGVEPLGAAIGPGIGPCCFEVGAEVLEAFADLGAGLAEGRMLDLPEVARRQLIAAGVPEDEIETSDLCTRCRPDLFFSHRGLGPDTGRQAGLGWLN